MMDIDPPNARCLLIYSSRIEDGKGLENLLSSKGIKLMTTSDLRTAKKIVQSNDCDYLISDVSCIDCDGMKLLEWAQSTILGIKTYGILRVHNHEMFCQVYKLGVDGCFYFDSISIDQLCVALDEIMASDMTSSWHHRNSSGFQDCSKRIVSESDLDSTLLLIGPDGVGKSAIAQLIHNKGKRRAKPFVVAECAHCTDAIESMKMFRGPESGVKHPLYRNQQGLLAQANGGTLFIHEVCKLPLEVQEVLATVIERKVFVPKNLTKEIPFTGRIIISSKADLAALTSTGDFSRSLYHAICGNVLRVPPLTDCMEDVIPLAQCFIRQNCISAGIAVPTLTKGAINKLENHLWGGNVRELFSVITGACASFNGSTIGKDDIVIFENTEDAFKHSRKFNIRKALRHVKGNKAQAAKLLGITRSTLYTWMEEEGIPLDYR